MATVIVHGPQGCGKTRNAEALRKRFGCKRVIELDTPRATVQPGCLHLCNELPPVTTGARVLSFAKAMTLVRRKG
jgi:hypothetical protein